MIAKSSDQGVDTSYPARMSSVTQDFKVYFQFFVHISQARTMDTSINQCLTRTFVSNVSPMSGASVLLRMDSVYFSVIDHDMNPYGKWRSKRVSCCATSGGELYLTTNITMTLVGVITTTDTTCTISITVVAVIYLSTMAIPPRPLPQRWLIRSPLPHLPPTRPLFRSGWRRPTACYIIEVCCTDIDRPWRQ